MEYGYGEPPEIDPDIAQIQARQQGVQADLQAAQLPSTAFVASINGVGGNLVFQQGTVPAGITVTFTTGPGTVSLSLSGFGTLVTKNIAAAVADIATADATDLPTVIALANASKAKINELLGALRTAGHIAP